MYLLGFLATGGMVFAAGMDCADGGTWKLNVSKSKFTPGPAPKEVTAVVQGQGSMCDITTKGTDDKGSAFSLHETYPDKGSGALKFLEGGPPANSGLTITTKRIDGFTRENTTMREGKQVGAERRVMSKDGKTVRATRKGVDEHGKPFDNVEVYERQ